MVVVRQCSVQELCEMPAFFALLELYASESGMAGMPAPKADIAAYARMESAGFLKILGAFADDVLVGFINVLVTVLPHYSAPVATVESLFVEPSSRKLGAARELLGAAEALAKQMSAVGILVTAALGARLHLVLERTAGYRESHRVFFKAIA